MKLIPTIVAFASGLVLLSGCGQSSPDADGQASGGAANAGAGGTAAGGVPSVGGGSGGESMSSGGSLGGSSSGGASTGGTNAGGTSAGGSSVGGGVASGGAMIEPREPVVAAPGTELVIVDASVQHQSFEGWGTSLCWWANHVGGWEPAARDQVIQAVVDPVVGMGYNIFRYNIGGGENPAHDHMGEHREMPGFQDADGTWTWENDARQRAILLGIQQVGTDLIFEAFSNSPPYWMTKSGCASGSGDGSSNLKDDSYEAFADYLTEVVLHYRDEHGVTFRTLEPLNEPYANWWTADGSQEGCHFDPSQQERIIQATAQQLSDKGLTGTVISASDENSMDDALRNLRTFSDETLAVVGQINVHSYAGSRRSELKALTADLGKRLWQSESGPLGQSISDDTEAALFMAERIIDDLRDLKAEAWVDWQSGDPSRSWASFTLNDTAQSHSPLKRFYMHAGFSRYIRPGATFIDVDNANMVAAVSPGGHSLTLVVRNGSQNAAQKYTFDLTSLPTVSAAASVHRTSRTEDLEAQPDVSIQDYSLVVEIPAYSVTTLVISMP